MKNLKLSPVIEPLMLNEIINNQNLIIIDSGSDRDAFLAYEKEHIAGAHYFDLNTILSSKGDPMNGGRHPLPKLSSFLKTLKDYGISTETHVVVYDNKQGCNAAARLWWMLKAVGISKVQVLNGGFQNAKSKGIMTNDIIPKLKPSATKIQVSDWQLPYVYLEAFKKLQSNPETTLIDVRSASRYKGIEEPIDLIAGHIPGAINIPFQYNLNADGTFLSVENLIEKYQNIKQKAEKIVIYCGSGVTACHTVLAFAIAGLPIPILYVGSWSEWSRN